MPETGLILKDTYEICEKLGSGGAGTVYKTWHKRMETFVAIKLINKDLPDFADVRAEVDILKSLRHTNLPVVHDYFRIDDQIYMVMDYISGKSLQDLKSSGKRFTEAEICSLFVQLCDCVKYLHAHIPPIIHSDIKPANIMLSDDGTLYLIDFNISRMAERGRAQSFGGSRRFAAPEQLSAGTVANRDMTEPVSAGSAYVDKRTDIYGIGTTIYYLLTGLTPKDGNISTSGIHFSRMMARLISKAANTDPSKRYSDVSELKADLISAAKHAKNVPIMMPKPNKTVKKPLIIPVLAGFSVFCICAAFAILLSGDRSIAANKTLSLAADEYIPDEQVTLSDITSIASVTLSNSDTETEAVTTAAGPTEQYTDDGDFRYIEKTNNVTITGYTGSDTKVTFPAQINGKPVTQIVGVYDNGSTDGIFDKETAGQMTEIVIPEGVVTIGNHAFSGCSHLQSAVIPSTVTYIGEYAFSDCKMLRSITIPQGVSKICKYTFNGCKSLSSIEIHDNISAIENDAFYGCESLTDITIPESVKSIGYYAFSGCKNITITAPAGSYALQYAWENKYKAVSLISDTEISNNGYITAFDQQIPIDTVYLFIFSESNYDEEVAAKLKEVDEKNVIFKVADTTPMYELELLKHLPDLTTLGFFGIPMENTDKSVFSEFPALNFLSINSGSLTDISFVSGIKRLKWLDLSNNLIADISPIAKCKNLVYLRLYNNCIRDISPLYELDALTELSIDGNMVERDDAENYFDSRSGGFYIRY